MKIFVTGATGHIGEAVALAFARAGHEVHGLARTREKATQLAAGEVLPVLGAMDDPSAWAEVARACQVLVHCATEYTPGRWALERQTLQQLIEAGRAGKERVLLYTSGCWVYGDTGAAPATEDAPLRPPPGVETRLEVERLVLGAAGPGLRALVLRPGCVYGGGGSLTAAWFESATQGGAARVVGTGAERWSLVHRDDLAELYLRAAESPCSGEIFNAADRSRATLLDCARAASLAAGAGGRVEVVPVAEARKTLGPFADLLALDQHVDARKAVARLGWQPRHGGFVDAAAGCFAAWRARQRRDA